jgi:hypothetical protein
VQPAGDLQDVVGAVGEADQDEGLVEGNVRVVDCVGNFVPLGRTKDVCVKSLLAKLGG